MSDEELALWKRISQLEEGLKNFSIAAGNPNLSVEGSFGTGFSINFVEDQEEPPPVVTPAAPFHLSVSLDYGLTYQSCDEASNVPGDATASFADIEADLTFTAGISNTVTADTPLVFTCPDPCSGYVNTVTTTFEVYLYFDGTDYWILANVFHDGTPFGICGDGQSHDLPDGVEAGDSVNIGTNPIGSHAINYTSTIGLTDFANFTIVIS
jgi:hypothetical protein